MNEQQALQIIKQHLDNALTLGLCKSLEQANALAQAFHVIQSAIPIKRDNKHE
jgi:hypothetical protein